MAVAGSQLERALGQGEVAREAGEAELFTRLGEVLLDAFAIEARAGFEQLLEILRGDRGSLSRRGGWAATV